MESPPLSWTRLLLVVFVAGLLIGGIGALLYGAGSPLCARTESYSCAKTRCTVMMPMLIGKTVVPICMARETYQSTCDRCVEKN